MECFLACEGGSVFCMRGVGGFFVFAGELYWHVITG